MAPPGRRRTHTTTTSILLSFFLFFSSSTLAASAVLGVDFGTEYIKGALVKPGVPLEIVLTKDSKRKEASAVAFKPLRKGAIPAGSFPERFYGSDAVALQARFPGDVYPNLKHLLGVAHDSHVVDEYKGRYPALKTHPIDGRKTIGFLSEIFATDEERVFTVEELVAMKLKNLRENAISLAGKGSVVQDAVFTVPPFYTVEERRALEVAARLAGLRVLGFVSDGLAVGINYATTRTFPDVSKGEEPEINLVFDMGAGSTSVTVLKFQSRSVKDIGRTNKTIHEVIVVGTGYDRTLGGDAMNAIIVDDMVKAFVQLPGAKSASITAERVKGHGRTASKLFKEAERIRQVLSANTETSGFFEGFFEDVDFRYKLSRAQFEPLVAEFASKLNGPIDQALEAAGLTIKDIGSVIVHGGATRTPFVHSYLEKLAGKGKLRANVNSDEAAVFGAAFKAAAISPSFRVKEIIGLDIQGYPYSFRYKVNSKDRDQNIFTASTKLGIVKDLPFQMTNDFEFTMHQTVPGAGEQPTKQPVLHFRSGNLTSTITKMVEEDKCDKTSVNNYVQVRLSPITGTPEVLSAWVTCEGEGVEPKGGIVDGVKNLFGMGGKKGQEPLKEAADSTLSSSTSSASPSSSQPSNIKAKDGAKRKDNAESLEKKKMTIKSAITYDVKQLGYEKHSRKEFKRMQERLAAFDASDKSRRVREEVLNSLEAFTYRSRDYLDEESFIGASTAAVRSALEKTLSDVSDWMSSESADATEEVLKNKLKELEDIVHPVLRRHTEALGRPGAIQRLKDSIAQLKEYEFMVDNQVKIQSEESSKSSEAVSKASASAVSPASASSSADPMDDLEGADSTSSAPAGPEITEVPTIYTNADIEKIKSLTTKVQKWLDDSEAKQSKLESTDDPVFTIKEVEVEKKRLDDLVWDLMRRRLDYMRQQETHKTKPKAKPKPAKQKPQKTKKGRGEASEADAFSDPELQAAMKKVGIDMDDIKVVKPGDDGSIKGDQREKLKKQGINEDSSDAKILAAIERLAKETAKNGHDEL